MMWFETLTGFREESPEQVSYFFSVLFQRLHPVVIPRFSPIILVPPSREEVTR